jgi:hypothetical protein
MIECPLGVDDPDRPAIIADAIVLATPGGGCSDSRIANAQ